MSSSGGRRLRSASGTLAHAVAEDNRLGELCINTIRTLSMDAGEADNSGHSGAPMALARVIYTLWRRFLRFDPDDPIWSNRDRFVLSNSHASMLLYAMLHLTGVKAAIDEGVPAHVLSVALFERFAWQGKADFVDKLLSAMRREFGGHAEKTPGK